MFGLFKKQKGVDETTSVLVAEKPVENLKQKTITSKDIQEDIHKSFNEILKEFDLKESKETQIENYKIKLESFKEENKSIYDKIEKLKYLNLSSTPTAKDSLKKLENKEKSVKEKINKVQNEIREAKKINDLVSEYNLKYPGFKFVSDSVMIQIMHKYNLVLGEAFTYAREIPDKSLEIIGKFSHEIKSSEEILQLVETRHGLRSSFFKFKKKPQPIIMSANTPDDSMRGFNTMHIHDPRTYNKDERVVREITISMFKMIAPESHFEIPTVEGINFRGEYIDLPIAKLDKQTRKFKLDVSALEKNEAKKREVLDPIAVLEVKGGYIIMDAWDKEAEIPEIKNPILN